MCLDKIRQYKQVQTIILPSYCFRKSLFAYRQQLWPSLLYIHTNSLLVLVGFFCKPTLSLLASRLEAIKKWELWTEQFGKVFTFSSNPHLRERSAKRGNLHTKYKQNKWLQKEMPEYKKSKSTLTIIVVKSVLAFHFFGNLAVVSSPSSVALAP